MMSLLRLLRNSAVLVTLLLAFLSFGGEVNITADKFESRDNILIYKGNVVAVLSGNKTIKCNLLKIYLKKGKVEKIEAIGKVVYKDGKYTAMGNRMIYKPSDKKIFLIGNAVVSSSRGVLKGDRIVYDLRKKSVDVTTTKRVSSVIILDENNEF